MLKLKGKKVLVVGLGRSGQSAVRYLLAQGAKVTVTDLKTKLELNDELKALGELKFEQEFGKHNPKTFSTSDLIVLSPGVPSNIEGLAEARAAKVQIVNDIELAYEYIRELNVPLIAVTGSNGKTTTATLIAENLRNDGKNVFLAGNIGHPVLNLLISNEKPQVVVLEVSSFQLESIDQFKPDIAVVTNLEPNHLDRYPTGLDAYFSAKRRILKNADKNTVLVTNLDNEKARILTDGFPGKTYFFTRRNPITIDPSFAEKFKGAYFARPQMRLKLNGKEEVFDLLPCKLPGDHNKENLMASAVAAMLAGGTRNGVAKTVENFKGVSHRLEFVRKKDGVVIFNDSKATSVPAVTRALQSFAAPVILIAGGRDKDQDFTPLVDLVKKRVKNLILIGEAKEKINRAIGDFSETFLVGTFEEAVLIAYQKSRNGDVVLLSPGCASYDMFKSYEERGDYFKKLVTQL